MTAVTADGRRESAVGRFLRTRWLSILIVIVAVIFIAQNRQETTIQLFAGAASAPLWVVLAVLFLAGAITGALRTRRRAGRR